MKKLVIFDFLKPNKCEMRFLFYFSGGLAPAGASNTWPGLKKYVWSEIYIHIATLGFLRGHIWAANESEGAKKLST